MFFCPDFSVLNNPKELIISFLLTASAFSFPLNRADCLCHSYNEVHLSMIITIMDNVSTEMDCRGLLEEGKVGSIRNPSSSSRQQLHWQNLSDGTILNCGVC